MTWKWRPSRSFPLCVAFGHSVYHSNRKVTSTTTRSHYFHQLANPAPTFVHIYFQSRFPIYAPGSYHWTHGTLHAVPRRAAQQWWSRRSEAGEWSGSVRKGAQWIMRHCWGHCSVTGFLVPSTLLSEWFSGERHKAPCVFEVSLSTVLGFQWDWVDVLWPIRRHFRNPGRPAGKRGKQEDSSGVWLWNLWMLF